MKGSEKMSDFYTKVNFLDRTHLFADYHKMIVCLTLRMSEIEYISGRLKRFSGFGIESQVYNINKCCRELDRLKEDIRTEYYSLVEIIDIINKYEKDAANTIGYAAAKEQAQKAAFEAISKLIEAIIGPCRIIPGLLHIVNPITPFPFIGMGILTGGRGSIPPGIGIRAYSDIEVTDNGVSATVAAGKTSASFDAGDVSGEVNAYVGKVEGKLKSDFSFFNWESKYSEYADGKSDEDDGSTFINAELAAGLSYNAFAADAKVEAGDDMFGSALSAEGGIGNAELSGKGEFSIGDEGINFNASGKAMVSAAEGEVKGTINFLGFEITGSLEGYAGAAGVKGKFGFEDGKFVAKGGAAALIGGGAGIEIGLNDTGAKAVKSVVDKGIEIGKDVIDTGKDIVNTGKEFIDSGVDFIKSIDFDGFLPGWF